MTDNLDENSNSSNVVAIPDDAKPEDQVLVLRAGQQLHRPTLRTLGPRGQEPRPEAGRFQVR